VQENMAEKFANFRWVKEGFLDNRQAGFVVGKIAFAALGEVEFCLEGDCKGELKGKVFQFRNTNFLDDMMAADRLAEFEIPQIGRVSLISFDPHPLLEPHPYIEWFSHDEQHYRIELLADEAWMLTDEEARQFDEESLKILNTLKTQL
jgi:hypothetical protein